MIYNDDLNFVSLFKETWEKSKSQFINFAFYFLVVLVFSTLADEYLKESENFAFILFGVIIMLLQPWFQLGFMRMSLNILDNKKIELLDFSFNIKFILKFLLLVVLNVLIILFFLLLFIIPGIIVGISLSFGTWIFLDQKMGIIDSLNFSRKITYGYKKKLLLIYLGFIIFNILGALFFGIGILFTAPFTIICTGLIYKKLVKSFSSSINLNNIMPTKKKTAVKKVTAKKPAAKKVVKKVSAKNPVAKTAVKKVAAKKPAAKTAVKKVAAKKPATKKAVKKVAVKKPAAKKVVKKVATKKK